MDGSRASRLAVLIDADNVSPAIAEGLFEEIAKLGQSSVRRIYGDFTSANMNGWNKKLSSLAIQPHHQPAYTTQKNSSDIALVIDGMDLLHGGRLDGFCLVSSDSDFTRLASRIREEGLEVYGFGERNTPESLRQACTRFIYTDILREPSQPADKVELAQTKAKLPASAAIPLLKVAVSNLESETEWVPLSPVGAQLLKVSSDFDSRTYGYAKLSELVRNTGEFDVEQPEGGIVRIRLKSKDEPKQSK